MRVDYLVVGAGLTGAVIARLLSDAGREVLVVDRRSHIGGNVFDHYHSSGIRVHTYGPHYFRTSSERIWEWATRFGEFYQYEAEVLTDVNGELVQWPPSEQFLRNRFGSDSGPKFNAVPENLEEAALALMPKSAYAAFVKEYNEKQWGRKCTELSRELCRRFEVRKGEDRRLTPSARYQGIPVDGYAEWTRRMFAGIPVILQYDYLQRRQEITAAKYLVFTGPIDEFFDFDCGRLQYRGQRRVHSYHPDIDYLQPCGQVNNPQHSGGLHIRTLEWKHMLPKSIRDRIKGTVITTETPFTPDSPSDYEYPMPDEKNAKLYQAYYMRANGIDRLLVAGRLGEYRYYDMDQAIARAMMLATKLL